MTNFINMLPSMVETRFRTDWLRLLKKYTGHLPAINMLAMASYTTGQLAALQDKNECTPEVIAKLMSENISLGNNDAVIRYESMLDSLHKESVIHKEWCQPKEEGRIVERKFMILFEDDEKSTLVFDNEEAARKEYEKAVQQYECWLVAPLQR